MASVEVEPMTPIPVTDESQATQMNEKVTTIPKPDKAIESQLSEATNGDIGLYSDQQDKSNAKVPEPNDKANETMNDAGSESYAAVTADKEDDEQKDEGSNGTTQVEDDTLKTNGVTEDGAAKGSNGLSKSYADVATDEKPDDENKSESTDAMTQIGDDAPYAKLPSLTEIQASQQAAWSAGGIRFAPLRVPINRRLQTAAVLFHCMGIILFTSAFWLICANPLTWPILVPYLVHLTFSTAATSGKLNYRSEYMRSLPLWRLFASYFPAKLHKTHDLPPERKYIFGYHPHGIISHGAWLAFATNALGFSDLFPGITSTLLTLDSNFRLPFYRDWILAMGLQSVSKESIWNILTKGGPNGEGQGRSVTIVIGGARESLEAEPGTLRLILKGRKGFVKMALRTGADLVPVVAFGETDLYDQLSPKQHPLVHKIQMFLLRVFKFTLPALHGRGVLNYDVGLMPYRRPLNVVIGKPIPVDRPHGPQPAQEDIDRLHELYIQEVERLWDAYKDQFAVGRKSDLQIIS